MAGVVVKLWPASSALEETVWGPRRCMPLVEASKLLARLDVRYWIAGGWAADLFLGEQRRAHGDIDVVVLRDDQAAIGRLLRGWSVLAADPPGTLRPWDPLTERLEKPVQDIWCRPLPSEPFCMQFMLSDVEDGELVFKRDRRIRVPLDRLGYTGPLGLTAMRPEIALLYKATSSWYAQRRDTNDADFEAVLPALDGDARRWLQDALEVCRPEHLWIERITLQTTEDGAGP